jgi:hypothetical protein
MPSPSFGIDFRFTGPLPYLRLVSDTLCKIETLHPLLLRSVAYRQQVPTRTDLRVHGSAMLISSRAGGWEDRLVRIGYSRPVGDWRPKGTKFPVE